MDILRAATGLMIRSSQKARIPTGLNKKLARGLGWLNRAAYAGPRVCPVGSFAMVLDLAQYIDSKIYYTGSFEPETVAVLRKLVPPGAHVADIGANIGYISLVLADCVGATGQVYAFEPSQWSFDRLVRNASLNPALPITSWRAAVSDRAEKSVRMSLPNGYRLDGRVTATEQEVDLLTLDRWCETQRIEKLDLVKIDTDGWEAHIIDGAAQTLKRFRPTLLFEFGPGNLKRVGRDGNQLLGALEDLGYRFYAIPSLDSMEDLRTRTATFAPDATVNLVARVGDLP